MSATIVAHKKYAPYNALRNPASVSCASIVCFLRIRYMSNGNPPMTPTSDVAGSMLVCSIMIKDPPMRTHRRNATNWSTR